MTSHAVKIAFTLVVEDGYPPISVERLNAIEVASGQYEIRNSPFFIPEVAYGDIVDVYFESNGRLAFKSCLKQSVFKAISIIILDSKMDVALMDLFRGQDCVIEYGEFGTMRMVAVGIPGHADYTILKNALDNYESGNMISYAELVV